MPESDDGETVVVEYQYDTAVVVDDAGRYHYVNPMGDRVQSFDSEDRARLYADIQSVIGGFREEKTGERGVPPAVARAFDENLLMAYHVATPTMGVSWTARAFGIDESEVRTAVELVREKAERKRDETG
ncbi:hypothetical protein [Halorubrum vacuolatum]|uniref:Uncharacterized protein n=1 Tax=Halorubrum vacuolatum TaxID=63740 RepID=A0A238YJU6_HALVU|nr:hypothetical protein [Halorubrum vacuolatum]SNR71242.1 hypothetical protein SAMN06264855_1522 [Halorubrum vacuolatum]